MGMKLDSYCGVECSTRIGKTSNQHGRGNGFHWSMYLLCGILCILSAESLTAGEQMSDAKDNSEPVYDDLSYANGIINDLNGLEALEISEVKECKPLYERMRWLASDYFPDQPEAIAFCHAIENRDLKKMSELLRNGLDINTKGKDNMTFLMWAFASDLHIFEYILEMGGNPNVCYLGNYIFFTTLDDGAFTQNFPKGNVGTFCVVPELAIAMVEKRFSCFQIRRGESVVHIAARGADSLWLKAVLEHGGDPNLCFTSEVGDPVCLEIMSQRTANYWLLKEAGHHCHSTFMAADEACVLFRFKHFDDVIRLLEITPNWQRRFLYALDMITEPSNTPLSEEEYSARSRLMDYLRSRGVEPERYQDEFRAWKNAVYQLPNDQQGSMWGERYGIHEKDFPEDRIHQDQLEGSDVAPRLPARILTGKIPPVNTISDGTIPANSIAANVVHVNPTSHFEYEKSEDGVMITSAKTVWGSLTAPAYGNFSVPAEIEGLPVVGIGSNAFAISPELVTVTLPKSMKTIGQEAFAFCPKLTSVTIPEGVTEIETSAFAECGDLKSITIPGSVKIIRAETFASCENLEFVEITEGVTRMEDFAFSDCKALKQVTLPKSMTKIGDMVFWGCDSLTTIAIPEGVTEIGKNAFQKSEHLTICTPQGSAAERFAKTAGIRVVH